MSPRWFRISSKWKTFKCNSEATNFTCYLNAMPIGLPAGRHIFRRHEHLLSPRIVVLILIFISRHFVNVSCIADWFFVWCNGDERNNGKKSREKVSISIQRAQFIHSRSLKSFLFVFLIILLSKCHVVLLLINLNANFAHWDLVRKR